MLQNKSSISFRYHSGLPSAQANRTKIGTIHQCIRIAQDIIDRYPHIAKDYTDGMCTREICVKYALDTYYKVSQKTAIGAISIALRGYNGEMMYIREKAFGGLLKKEEYSAAAHQIRSKIAKKVAHILQEENRGIFSTSASERGKKGGPASLKQKAGIHNPENMAKLRLASILALGRTPVSPEERTAIFTLSQDPEYQKKSRIQLQKIAEKINNTFHNGEKIRTTDAIQKIIKKAKDAQK